MREAGAAPATLPLDTEDAWLGGRLTLRQPARGHRVGTDAALLAAAAGEASGAVVDVGAGVGAVGLAIALRNPRAEVACVEIDAELAALAGDNAARNGLSGRVRALGVDLFDRKARRAAGLADESAACVVANPPFYEPGTVRASPDAAKARAHVFSGGEGGLEAWIKACLALTAPGGRFVAIVRPDALPAVLGACAGRMGGVRLRPVFPREGADAHRLLVSGVKGSRAPLTIAPGLVLHGADGRTTAEAEAIHRGEAALDWGR